MNPKPTPVVRHEEAENRYVIDMDGQQAVADYELVDDKQVFTHTYVPPELRGRGLAEALVRTALEDARKAGRKVVPACSYVGVFIDRNKQYKDLLA
jgi:uncharacterized protein